MKENWRNRWVDVWAAGMGTIRVLVQTAVLQDWEAQIGLSCSLGKYVDPIEQPCKSFSQGKVS